MMVGWVCHSHVVPQSDDPVPNDGSGARSLRMCVAQRVGEVIGLTISIPERRRREVGSSE